MANIAPTMVYDNNGTAIVTWSNLTTSDVGTEVDVSRFAEKTIHVVSSGGGTAQVQGSNDGSNWVNIGSALAAGTLTQLAVNPRYIRIGIVATATLQSVILEARPGGR